MTSDDFRRIALALPEVREGAHQGHPDFRVKGKIFATLFTRDGIEYGMLKLNPNQQFELVGEYPDVFGPCAGAWGRGGATQVALDHVRRTVLKTLRGAMLAAWCNVVPKQLADSINRQQLPAKRR